MVTHFQVSVFYPRLLPTIIFLAVRSKSLLQQVALQHVHQSVNDRLALLLQTLGHLGEKAGIYPKERDH